MRRSYDRCVELLCARYDAVEISHFAEPQQDAVTDLEIWICKDTVVVCNVSMVELQRERVVGEQPLVVGTSMITTETKELLIPQTRRFDVAYGDHGLGLSRGHHPDDNADSIARRIIDLDKPSLTAIKLRAAADRAAGRLDLPQRAVKAIGRDPQHRTAGGDRRDVGGQLTDQTGRFKASAAGVNRPAEDAAVEGSRMLDVACRQLQVLELAMRRCVGFAHACSIDYGSAVVNCPGFT